MADAQLSGTVILAYPREGIDEFIPRLRVVVPEVEVHVVPYVGQAQSVAATAAPDDDRLLGLLAGLEARINGIEARMAEQEQMLRHTLTMVIEFIEDDDQQRHAA